MPPATLEVVPSSSPVEFERHGIIHDSELLRPDGSGSQSFLPFQGQDEHQVFQQSTFHRTSPEPGIESRTNSHREDSIKGIPRSLSFSWSSFLADAVSILVTIPFIILGFLLVQAKGKVVERNALQNFENGIRVAATALPFVFAAIFGRLTAQVARWKLERGGSLPSIEQWLGSRTLFSAFLTQVKLGGLNVIGLSMTIAWALSPLGAQSILRVIGTSSREVKTNGSATYLDTNTPSTFTMLSRYEHELTPDISNIPQVMNSMYAASLMSPDSIKSSGQDFWGNIKVPYLLPHADSLSEDEWVRLPNGESVEFSSLVGLPFAANVKPGLGVKSNFTMESSHIQLQCSPFITTHDKAGYLDYDTFNSYDNTSLAGWWYPCGNLGAFPKCPKNNTFQALTRSLGDTGGEYLPWILALDSFLDCLWLKRMCETDTADANRYLNQFSPATFINEKGIFTSKAKLQLLAWTSADLYKNPRATTCGVSQSWVESWVDCNWSTSPDCAVTAQRPSQKQHASSNITHLSFPSVFTKLQNELPNASGLRYSRTGGLTDASLIYLVNTSWSYISSRDARSNYTLLDNLTESDISRRLGQLINTYLTISQAYASILAGSLSKDPTNDLGSPVNNITTTMSIVGTEEVYTINSTWLAAFFIAAIAMLIGSILGAVFCHSSITPEILGFASAAIRYSKYVDLAPGFGALGGLEMTKAFEKIEFRYGVVNKLESGGEVLGISWKINAERAKKGVPYL